MTNKQERHENERYTVRAGADERSGGENDGEGLLVRFLNRELSDDGSPQFLEADFGGDIPVALADGTRFPVHGRIDRVDLEATDDGELSARVIDYKTFGTSTTDAVRGLDFQIPSYLFGARRLVEEELGEVPETVDGEYRVIKPPTTISHPASLEDRVERDLGIDFDRFLEEIVPDRVERAVSGVESGAFHPTIAGEEAANCHYCEFADVCDVRHHRRFDAIEALDREDHPTYIPPGARHGELTDHVAPQPGGEER